MFGPYLPAPAARAPPSPASGGGFLSCSALELLPPPLAGEGWGGGFLTHDFGRFHSASQRFGDHLQNPGAILQNIVVPKPKDLPPSLRQPSIPDGIGTRQSMLTAVRFDN